MIARRLKEYLESIDAVASRLKDDVYGVRIRVTTIPQGMPLPYVRLSEISSNPEYHLGGEAAVLPTVVQVDVWAETDDDASEIAELIRLAPLSGYRGQWTAPDGTLTNVKNVTIEAEFGTFEDPKDDSDDMRYRNTRDYRILYERTVT